jgi:hypothetical protein
MQVNVYNVGTCNSDALLAAASSLCFLHGKKIFQTYIFLQINTSLYY